MAHMDMKGNVLSAACPSRDILETLTSKWGFLILLALDGNTLRFSELRRCVDGVSERMLSHSLKRLIGYGFVLRESKPVVPPHTEYRLTDLGTSATRQMRGLASWIEDNLPEIHANRVTAD